MKNISAKILVLTSLCGAFWMSAGCAQIPEIETELVLDRCLTPTNLSRTPHGESVTFTWSTSKGSTSYVIEIYSDENDPDGSKVDDATNVTENTYTFEGLEIDRTFYARVKGVSEEIGDSRWATFASFDTYSAREPVADLAVGERQQTSIQLTWTPDTTEDPEASADAGVNAIWYVPASDPEAEPEVFNVDEAAAEAGDVTVTGLSAGVKYILTVHYGNAPRGSVSAYTLPDTGNAQEVSSSEALVQALNDGAEEILLKYSGSPYDLGYSTEEGVEPAVSLEDLDHPVTIYGEEGNGESGNFPVVYGNFTIADGCTSIILENMAFDGENYDTAHLLSFNELTTDIQTISIRNCTLTGFKRGIAYPGDKKVPAIQNFIIDDIVMSDTSGDGGESIGFRKSGCAFGTISITNSTFDGGMRDFMRIDKDESAPNTIGTLVISNNTFNNLTTASGSNGLFYVRAAISSATLTGNIFMNMENSTASYVWCKDNAGTFKPSVVENNFFYNVGGNFWNEKVFTEAQAVAGGGAVLAEDPCAESMAGDFHVMNADVMAAGAGDPRWLVEGYVKPEEDLTLNVIDPTYVWDFTDGSAFYNTADKDMVRGGLRFYVTSNPVEFDTDNGRLYFTAAGQMGATEPTDCAIGFKVNRPGSVVISTSPSIIYPEAHATVSLDGKHVGAVPADAEEFQVSIDITEGEEHMVYIYGCDPFYITSLTWSDYIGGGDTQLATPENVQLTAASATVDSSDPVILSWDEVPDAGSYDIMNGDEVFATVTEPSYEIIPSAVGAGVYNFTIVAKPAADDAIREASEPSEVICFEVVEILSPVSAYSPTTWGEDYFAGLASMFPDGITSDGVYGNLGFVCGGSTFKFGTTGGAYRVQSGSGDPGTKACYQIMVPGPGTLNIQAISSGDARNIDVYAGTALKGTYNAPGKEETAASHDIVFSDTEVSSGSIINICSNGGSVNYLSFTWTPEDGGQSGSIGYDETAINEPYMADFSNATTFPSGAFEEIRTVEKVSYAGASGKAVNFEPGEKRVKFNGKPSLDDNGLPEYRYACFKVTKPGTVHFLIRSSSNSDGGRNATVALAKEIDGQLQVVELYSDFAKTSGTDPLTVKLTPEHLSGATSAVTLYFFSKDNTVNLYQLGFTPAQ